MRNGSARQERCSCDQCRGELSEASPSESEAIEAEVNSTAGMNERVVWWYSISVRSVSQPSAATGPQLRCLPDERETQERA